MEKNGALKDIVILDLTRVLAGPYCTMLLADMGANVIKIEIPGRGDDTRSYAPFQNGESMYFANFNRDKKGITLNLKDPKGKEIFLELAKKADVVVENYRTGVMDRLGLGYETLREVNPKLIYAAVSGFGSYGPYSDRPGYDIISQAMGGLMSITGQPGDPPTRAGNAMGDVLGGLNLTIGILAALHARGLTGKGQRVDISLVDSVVSSLEAAPQRYFQSGNVPQRIGNRYAPVAPYDAYEAKDGYFVIGCGNQKLYELLCNKILERPELITDERFTTLPLRVKNNAALKEIIEKWSANYTIDEAVEKILAVGVPAAQIFDIRRITEDPHIVDVREMFVPLKHPVIGDMRVSGCPIKLMDTKICIDTPAPTLGQDNEEIFGDVLGIPAEKLQELKTQGII